MRGLLRIRRLQIAGRVVPQPKTIQPIRLTRLDVPFFAPTCIAGPSSRPYSSLASSSSQINLEDAQRSSHAYFTASRPIPPHVALSSRIYSEGETDKLRTLLELINRPSASRTDYVAQRVFDLYRSLSPFTRQELPRDMIHKILRNVVPSAQNLDYGVPGRISRDFRLARAWEERFKVIIADMISLRGGPGSSGEGATSDQVAYRFVLARLARTGRMEAVESIVGEMSSRGIVLGKSTGEEVQLHEFRLLAIRNRLTYLSSVVRPQRALSLRRYHRQLGTILPVFWSIVNDLQRDGLAPRQLTCTYIVQIISLFWRVIPPDHEQGDHLSNLFEEILKKGYGLDMEYLTVDKGARKAEIQSFVVRAIVDHFGRKGEVWKMLSAFEVLTQTSAAEAEYRTKWNKEDVDEDDVGPTLADMEAKESQERKGMMMWENTAKAERIKAASQKINRPPVAGQQAVSYHTPFSYNDYLPSSALSPSTIFSLPYNELEQLAQRFNPADPGMSRTDIFSTMLRHACAAQNYPLAHHILRVAVRDARELRSAWLARVISRARMHDRASADGTATYTGIRNLGGAALNFDVDWFLSIRPLVLGMHSTAVGDKHLRGGPVAQMFALMEEAQDWLSEERDVFFGTLYPQRAETIDTNADVYDSPAHLDPWSDEPLLGDIYDLTTHRSNALSTLDRIRSVHLESIDLRASQLAKSSRKRMNWYASKIRAREEEEVEAIRVAEKKAMDRASRQERKRVVVEEGEGMMLAAATG